MTYLASVIFATVGLWILCGIESTHSLSPSKAVHSQGSASRKKNEKRGQRKVLYELPLFPRIPKTDQLPKVKDKGSHGRFVVPPFESRCSDFNLIERFTSKFANKILSDNRLYRIYGTYHSPEKAQAAYHKVVFVVADNLHTLYPRAVADTVSSAIRATYGNLTLTENIQASGYSAATYMVYKNALTCENLDKLVNTFVYYVKQAAYNVADIPDPRDAYIKAATEAFVHFMTSQNLFTADDVGHLAHLVSDALCTLVGVPVPLLKDSCTEDNLIQRFVFKLLHAVLKSESSSAMFVTTLPPEKAAAAYDRILHNRAASVHLPDPKGVTKIVSDAIRKTFGKLTLTQHVMACGYSMSEYLKAKNVLTCENLDDLCDGYVMYIKEAASTIPNVLDPRDGYIQAISDSYIYCMASLNLFTTEGVIAVFQNFANSLYSLTGVSPCE